MPGHRHHAARHRNGHPGRVRRGHPVLQIVAVRIGEVRGDIQRHRAVHMGFQILDPADCLGCPVGHRHGKALLCRKAARVGPGNGHRGAPRGRARHSRHTAGHGDRSNRGVGTRRRVGQRVSVGVGEVTGCVDRNRLSDGDDLGRNRTAGRWCPVGGHRSHRRLGGSITAGRGPQGGQHRGGGDETPMRRSPIQQHACSSGGGDRPIECRSGACASPWRHLEGRRRLIAPIRAVRGGRSCSSNARGAFHGD